MLELFKFGLFGALVVLMQCSILVGAQSGIETSSQNATIGEVCECSPVCDGDVGRDGCHERFVVREDCPCCKVCAQPKGSECAHPHRPCDTEYGLICSPEGICKAEYSCQSDKECPDDRFCLGQVCVDPCPILLPCQGNIEGGICKTKAHRPVCQCPPGTIANSGGDRCVPNNKNDKEETNDAANESAVTIQEKAEVQSSKGTAVAGGLKVLGVTHNSSTLILPSTKGGDIYFKAADSSDWQRQNVGAGQESYLLKGLLPNTQYTLKWSGTSGGTGKLTIDTLDGCVLENNMSYGVSEEWTKGCEHQCSCRPGGNVDCQPRCLFKAGDIKDPTCIEKPSPEDPECCVSYDCKEKEDPSIQNILSEDQKPGQAKLLVTEKTHNSVTLAWDDFSRARTHEGGYVVEYREKDENVTDTADVPWMTKHQPTGPTLPKLTVGDLKPSTIYEVRVSIYDVADNRESTETITVRTEPGCVYRNASYVVGEFFIGCEERCMCLVNGDTKCFERCSLPYFRAGSFKEDPLCQEQHADDDECCVVVQCATSNTGTVTSGINATSFTEVAYNQCSNVVCGPNAECVSSPVTTENLSINDGSDVTLGYCRCLDGFTGDPADLSHGCSPDPSAEPTEGGCTYKNSTYRSGEVFYDNCDYRCTCTANSEVECESRCEFPHEDGSEIESGCEYLPDPEDSCCKLRVCNSTSAAATDAARAPSLISEGCTDGNLTYAKNEKFYKGCQTQCICMGFGDVSCFPRCPPVKVMTDNPKRCETLPDPLDSCCSITVCDQETPDVMKANITEIEKEMVMMKERMKNMTDMEKEMLMKRMSEMEKEMLMKNISDMEMILQKMIEENNNLMTSNITEIEKEELKTNMTEIMMMMKDLTEMEEQITSSNMTDTEKEIIAFKLTEMQKKLTEEIEMAENHEMDEHTRLHMLGIEHSHDNMDKMKNHTHTHEDDTAHTHTGGHLPHSHDDMNKMKNHTHTHEDGTTHTHPGGHLPHSHTDNNDTDPAGIIWHEHSHDDMDKMKNLTHTHEDGTTHTHPVEHHSHPHTDSSDDMDNMKNHTHAHEIDDHARLHMLGIDHSHDNMDKMKNHTHTHEDGTTHTHPRGHLPHSHIDNNDTDPHGIIWHEHDHAHDDMDKMKNHTHAHEIDDHAHLHMLGIDHSHDDMDKMKNHTHTHEDGTTHTHPGGHLPHSHIDNNDTDPSGIIWHHHEDDMEDTINMMHMHEDGTTHSHSSSDMNKMKNHTHTHEDGTTHTHPGGHLPHSHIDNNDTDPAGIIWHTDEAQNETHEMDHDHMHTHDDGTTHSHPHDHMNESHAHTHTHEDGTTHTHPIMEEFHNLTELNTLEKKNRAEDLGTHELNILEVMPLNATSVKVRVGMSDSVLSQLKSRDDQYVNVYYSPDSLEWMEQKVSANDVQIDMESNEMYFYINDLQPSTPYQFRISYRDYVSSTSKARLLDGSSDSALGGAIHIDPSVMCSHKGRYYKRGQEFYDGCSHSCFCSNSLEVHCAAIECPVTFGLELIDPNCLEWDLDKDYVPTPPKCCAQVKCVLSAECHYMGQAFNNYDTIPRELTGCSKVCTCNYGNVTCRDLCDPISPTPPTNLNCAPEDAVRVTLPGETCCETWRCSATSFGGPPVVFPLPPDSMFNRQPESGFIPTHHHPATPFFGEVDVISKPEIVSQDPYAAHLMFATPSHFQGLPGSLYIRYTNDPAGEPNPEEWKREVIIPASTTIGQSQWEYVVTNLQPSTQYSMQIVLTILGADPVTSNVFTYTTAEIVSPPPPSTTPLANLDINAELYASEITKTSAKVSWRIFNDYELQYIDGVQVKYTAKDKLIPKFSQLFHRNNNQMDLRGLEPGKNYTVDLVFIIHKNQTTQVSNTDPITFVTLPEEDPYAFDIVVNAGKVSPQTAELFYSGVPEPEEKYINVYTVVYLREAERIDEQKFKIPKSGQEKMIFLNDLKPDTEYRVWLEAYLSNGRKKKSNVITITTKAGQLPKPEKSEVDPALTVKEGDGYYPALVAVAIIAAIACVGFLGLLVILLRKQNHAKAHINSSRNNAAYDNPSYKVGDNGYDMEMNGIKGSNNSATHAAEEP